MYDRHEADILAVQEEAHNFPHSPDYPLEDLKRVQDRLLEMGKTISKILTEGGVRHVLGCGSLIGAIRHKGFIPWDDDLDFWVDNEQYDEALRLLREKLPEDMIVHDETNDPIYWVGWSRVRDLKSEVIYDQYANDRHYKYRGICIDLYRIRRVCVWDQAEIWLRGRRAGAEAKLERGIITEEEIKDYYAWFDRMYWRWFVEYQQRIFNDIIIDDFYWCLCDADEFFPTIMADFEDTQFPVPNDPYNVLDHSYEGIKWWLLPPYEKRNPHYAKVIFK